MLLLLSQRCAKQIKCREVHDAAHFLFRPDDPFQTEDSDRCPPTQDNLLAEGLQFNVIMAESDLPEDIQWTIPRQQQMMPGPGKRAGRRPQSPGGLHPVDRIHAFQRLLEPYYVGYAVFVNDIEVKRRHRAPVDCGADAVDDYEVNPLIGQRLQVGDQPAVHSSKPQCR